MSASASPFSVRRYSTRGGISAYACRSTSFASSNILSRCETVLGLTRFIGVSEMLGAIGLILPALTHVLPWLTIAAAVGLALVMVCAAVFHASRREYSPVSINVVLLVLALFIVYGRWMLAPLA